MSSVFGTAITDGSNHAAAIRLLENFLNYISLFVSERKGEDLRIVDRVIRNSQSGT